MNSHKLDPEWVEHMKHLPESGMGFQHVTFIFVDGTEAPGTVFNCEQALIQNTPVMKPIRNIVIRK